MNTNEAFELLRPQIERVVNEASTEIKVIVVPTDKAHGDFYTTALRVIKLKEVSDQLMAFIRGRGIELTPELELRGKEYVHSYRQKIGKVAAETEWPYLEEFQLGQDKINGQSFPLSRLEVGYLNEPNPDFAKTGRSHFLLSVDDNGPWLFHPTEERVSF